MSIEFIGQFKIVRDYLLQDPNSRNVVIERRANLIRALLRIRYLTRRTLIRQVEFRMGFPSFGKKKT